MSRKKNKTWFSRKTRRIIFWILFLMVFTGVAAFFLLYKVERIEVLGSSRYEDREIREYIMKDPLAGNTILATLLHKTVTVDDLPFVESYTFEKINNHTLRVHVNERQLVGYIVQDDKKLYMDKDGVILEEISQEQEKTEEDHEKNKTDQEGEVEFHAAVRKVPQIIGFGHEKRKKGDKIEVWNEEVFYSLLGLSRMVEKYQIMPEMVLMENNGNITLVYDQGKIQCRIGKDYLMEEKIARIAAILPELSDKTGILHLEDYEEDTENIIFSQEEQQTLDAYKEKIDNWGIKTVEAQEQKSQKIPDENVQGQPPQEPADVLQDETGKGEQEPEKSQTEEKEPSVMEDNGES